MSLATLRVHDVTVVHAATIVDRYGNETKDWVNATRTGERWWIARLSESEIRERREAEVSGWVGYAPVGTVVTALDRVEWDGHVFEVDGPPNEAWTPRGPHHTECRLRVVVG